MGGREGGAKPQAWVVLSLVILGARGSGASAAPPAVSQVFPAGGQRGTTVAATLTGKFDWPVNVWAPGVDVTVGAESGKLEINIPADLAADRIWLRLHNPEGASALVPFLVGSLPEIAETEPNNTSKAAQSLAEARVTINGRLDKAEVDGFLVPLTAGQTLIAAVDANARLGSPMDAILQVATADGVVLAENHDAVGLDPRVVYTATTTGPHLVRLFAFPSTPDSTIAFRGGADYIYRLTLTTGPFVTHAIPLAVNAAAPGSVALHGWNLPPDLQRPVMPFGEPRIGEFAEQEPLGELRTPSGAKIGFAFAPEFAGAARVRLVPHAVAPSIPTADAEHPFSLTMPTVVCGYLTTPKQRDYYQLPLTKGQSVIVAVEAENLDFPVDPVVQLLDPQGGVVADVDDTGKNRDAVIVHTAKSDGNYRITVSDRYRNGNPRGYYRLSVRLEEPDFELTAATDAVVIIPGKPTEVTVNIVRRSLGDKALTVGGENLPEGVSVAEVVAEPKANKVTLSLTATGPAYSGPVRFVGRVTEPTEVRRRVRIPEKLGATWDHVWLTVTAPAN